MRMPSMRRMVIDGIARVHQRNAKSMSVIVSTSNFGKSGRQTTFKRMSTWQDDVHDKISSPSPSVRERSHHAGITA